MAVSDVAFDSCRRCITAFKSDDAVASSMPFADIDDGRIEFGTIVTFNAHVQVCRAAAGAGTYMKHDIILILIGKANGEDLR